jgi:DNA polymerase
MPWCWRASLSKSRYNKAMVASPSNSTNTVKAKQASKGTVVSELQHAWLKTMGVDVPWIKTKPATSTPKPQAAQVDDGPLAAPRPDQTPTTTPVSARVVAPPTPIAPVAKQAPELAPPELDLDGFDLAQLASAVHGCQRCGLCQGRQNAVPGEGSDRPTILIVGEAPGEQEDAQGQPFVGRSGQLLDNMLKAIGHDRHQSVYITNVVKCRPPGNRNPREEEIAACAPFLAKQIALLKPKVILAMGRFAAHALLKTDASLQQLREITHEIEFDRETLPVVVTYHPAYLLRRPVDKRLAWEDLKRLRALI